MEVKEQADARCQKRKRWSLPCHADLAMRVVRKVTKGNKIASPPAGHVTLLPVERWGGGGGVVVGCGLLAGLNTRKGQTYFLIIMNLPRLSHAGAWEPGGKVSPLLPLPPLEGPSPIKHPRVCQASAVLAPSS